MGCHVDFNLHRDQFSSDCQTVWDGCSPECYTGANFFLFDYWMLESWNFRHFKKKFGFWAVGVSKLVNFFNKIINNFDTSTTQNLSNFFFKMLSISTFKHLMIKWKNWRLYTTQISTHLKRFVNRMQIDLCASWNVRDPPPPPNGRIWTQILQIPFHIFLFWANVFSKKILSWSLDSWDTSS